MNIAAMTVGDLKAVLSKLPDFYEVHLQTGDSSIEALYVGDVGATPIVETTSYQGRHWLVLVPHEAVVEKTFGLHLFNSPLQEGDLG